jgi:hypothetical protein
LELSSAIVDSKNTIKDQRVACNRRVVILDRLEKFSYNRRCNI